MSKPSSTIYLVFIHAPANKFIPAFLTNFFTGSTAFHCGFLDTSDNTFFDMYKLPRKCVWPRYRAPKWVTAYKASMVTREHLEYFIKRDSEVTYGYFDYLSFGIKKVLSILGFTIDINEGPVEVKLPNFNGDICSEILAKWMSYVGYTVPTNVVMSPGELEHFSQNTLKLEKVELQGALW